MTTLLWLRADLRLHDHAVLADSLARLDGADGRLVALFCLDPRLFADTAYGFPKTDRFRARFLLESLADLRASMRARGGDLVVRTGKPEEVIPEIVSRYGVRDVSAHAEPMREEADVEAAVRKAIAPLGAGLHVHWGHTLFHIDDLPTPPERLPGVFTAWRKEVEARATVRALVPTPEALPPLPDGLDPGEIPSVEALGLQSIEADPRAVMVFDGGETAGLARLHAYAWAGNHLRRYKETRNGSLHADESTKLSPWLAHGCLSPRFVYHEAKRYEAERVANDSTYWLVFELLWRDYFRFYGVRWGDRLFGATGPKGHPVDWNDDRDDFRAWAAGRTGVPFVDAAMRELNATGWMSNRLRQNAASFLTKNLSVDWRLGAAYFESLLVDYDVTSNWGNWAYNAGVGADPRDRYFNIESQAKRYDPHGRYVRRWLPEIAGVPDHDIHAPHRRGEAALRRDGVQLGHTYPHPMLDVDRSYEAIRGASATRAPNKGRAGRKTSHRR